MPFGQTFDPRDFFVIGVLVVLEGVLSIDNALVLALLAGRLPKRLRPRALTYGLAGAFIFRILAICLAGFLLKWNWPKLVGGLYLIWVAVKEWIWPHQKSADDAQEAEAILADAATASNATTSRDLSTHTMAFWSAVAVIELTDIAFAVDSILAAVGTVPGREKLWIVIIGGMLGVILMRFAAVVFIRLLEKFPRFETSAYLLVAVIGAKLVVDYFTDLDFHSAAHVPFWIFWGSMIGCFVIGFVPQRRTVKT